jgi:hypothetical protein
VGVIWVTSDWEEEYRQSIRCNAWEEESAHRISCGRSAYEACLQVGNVCSVPQLLR